jgi:hypothetical protein
VRSHAERGNEGCILKFRTSIADSRFNGKNGDGVLPITASQCGADDSYRAGKAVGVVRTLIRSRKVLFRRRG